jgi:hypothetical protein
MKSVSEGNFRDNRNTYVQNMFPKMVPLMMLCGKYGSAGQNTDGSIIRRMYFSCCITKATNTHSEYEIIHAFPLQHWLRERASLLRYTYSACLSVCLGKLMCIL